MKSRLYELIELVKPIKDGFVLTYTPWAVGEDYRWSAEIVNKKGIPQVTTHGDTAERAIINLYLALGERDEWIV